MTVKNGVEFHARADSSDSSVERGTGRMPEAFPPLRLQVCLVVLFSELKNVRLKIIDLKGEWPEHGEAPNLVL